MYILSRVTARRLSAAVLLCAGLTSLQAFAQVSVRSIKVLGSKDAVEIEVEASERIVPQSQILSGPDRLVIDFPNAVPGNEVRSQSVDRGEVKDVRVGLFQKKPPVTRVVLDLTTAQSYQIFPNGRTVIIKLGGGANRSAEVAQPAQRPGLVVANYTTSVEPVTVASPTPPPLQVSYENGLLSISSDKATLSEVLHLVQVKTGADIAIPAGAEQERVVAAIEPAPAPEVLARLLNGSRFNFLIVNSPSDPRQLDKVILTPRGEMDYVPQAYPVQAQGNEAAEDDSSINAPPPNAAVQPPPGAPAPEDPQQQ